MLIPFVFILIVVSQTLRLLPTTVTLMTIYFFHGLPLDIFRNFLELRVWVLSVCCVCNRAEKPFDTEAICNFKPRRCKETLQTKVHSFFIPTLNRANEGWYLLRGQYSQSTVHHRSEGQERSPLSRITGSYQRYRVVNNEGLISDWSPSSNYPTLRTPPRTPSAIPSPYLSVIPSLIIRLPEIAGIICP